MIKYASSLQSFSNFWFISQQTKPFYLVEKGSNFSLPSHDFVYAHTLYIHTTFLSLVVQLGEKKKNENLNTAKKLEIVVKSSIVCVLYSFNAIKRFTFDPKDLGARFRNSPNLLQPLHVQSYGFCLQVRISSFKCTISFVLKSLDFCVFTKL